MGLVLRRDTIASFNHLFHVFSVGGIMLWMPENLHCEISCIVFATSVVIKGWPGSCGWEARAPSISLHIYMCIYTYIYTYISLVALQSMISSSTSVNHPRKLTTGMHRARQSLENREPILQIYLCKKTIGEKQDIFHNCSQPRVFAQWDISEISLWKVLGGFRSSLHRKHSVNELWNAKSCQY